MKCLHGEGPREQVEVLVEKTLKELGKKYKTKQYNRITVYRTGLLKKIILVYNYSDSTFQICGDKKTLENIKKRTIIYTSKVKILEYTHTRRETLDVESEKAVELLMKKQIIDEKLRHCKIRNILTPITTLIILLLIYIETNNPLVTILTTALIVLALQVAPITARINGKITYINSLTCMKLKKEKEHINRELADIMNKLRNENIKKIIALQLAHNRDNKKK